MEIRDFIRVLDAEGTRLATAAGHSGTAAPVPTCPGWTVADLLRHQTMVHRWAARIVGEALSAPYEPTEPDLDGAELLAHYREGHAHLVRTLRDAPDDLDCWYFFRAPSARAFWARRQAHETAVHRVDAEEAAGGAISPLPAAFASDGIDELLTGFHARRKSRVRSTHPRTLRVQATDTDDTWTVHLSQDPPHTDRGADGDADCLLRGTAGELYLALWNRRPYDGLRIDGDPAPAELWRADSAVTWS
ncbi:maleylpyruvate isomerase family mycothiol-dependent enzyme [Streptomyces sp. NPDC051940]|uniref:maleylpyruvate isomerase family mycothiol-dependent enzyme n=1 Tax=Streptomyces sp. NPDC051940 TaxID=3155675 RepID=UPI0034206DDD